MNDERQQLEIRLLTLLHQARDEQDEAARVELNTLLREQPQARGAMARLLVEEQALASSLREEGIVALVEPATTSSRRSLVSQRRMPGWLAWRPLTAAAAGIVFGMFCTSVVFGFVGQRQAVKKTPLPMMQPGFEDARMPLVKGFPPGPSLWTGDVAKVVSAEHGITPKDGHHMLRLETSEKGAPLLFPRLYQIIALPPSDTELREIEVSASFASADSGSSPHYSIRAYATSQVPEHLGPDWFRHRDEAIASAATGFDSPQGSTGWQSFDLRIQVPGKARSLVVFFGVKNQTKSPAKLPHYLDAVQVSFIESSTLP